MTSINTFTSEQNVPYSKSSAEFTHSKPMLSVSTSDVTSHAREELYGEVAKWNPFEDPTPFNQMTEDHIFCAEFDRIRNQNDTSMV